MSIRIMKSNVILKYSPMDVTYKHFEVSGTDKPVPSVVPWPTTNQNSMVVFRHFLNRITLKQVKLKYVDTIVESDLGLNWL